MYVRCVCVWGGGAQACVPPSRCWPCWPPGLAGPGPSGDGPQRGEPVGRGAAALCHCRGGVPAGGRVHDRRALVLPGRAATPQGGAGEGGRGAWGRAEGCRAPPGRGGRCVLGKGRGEWAFLHGRVVEGQKVVRWRCVGRGWHMAHMHPDPSSRPATRLTRNSSGCAPAPIPSHTHKPCCPRPRPTCTLAGPALHCALPPSPARLLLLPEPTPKPMMMGAPRPPPRPRSSARCLTSTSL